MQVDIDKITVPGWLVDLFITGGADNDPDLRPALRLMPALYSYELDHLIHVLGVLQSKLIYTSLEHGLAIAAKDLVEAYPLASNAEQKGMQRILHMLPALRLNYPNLGCEHVFNLRFDQEDNAIFDTSHSSLTNICGYAELYHSALRGCKIKNSIEINFDLYRKLELNERRLYLRLLRKLRQTLSQEVGCVMSSEDFDDMRIDEPRQHQRLLEQFSQKAFSLGYFSDEAIIGESGNFQFVPAEAFDVGENQLLQHAVAKLAFRSLSIEDLRNFAEGVALRQLTAGEVSGLQKLQVALLQPDSQLHGAVATSSRQCLGIPMLFIEWCMRNSPMHPAQLPRELQNSLFAEICYLTHENLIDNYRHFHRILFYDDHVRLFIGRHDACYSHPVKADRHKFQTSQPKNHSLSFELEGLTAGSEPSVDLQPSALSKKSTINKSNQQTLPSVRRDDAKRFEAVNIAKSELSRMKRRGPAEYKDLREKYIQSLSAPDQKILADIATRMRRDLFEQQMEKRLVRFMVANPNAWRAAPR